MGQTHEELRRQRRKIARAVAAGLTIRQAATRFQVSEGTIRKACAENNVTPQRRGRGAGGTLTLQILAELINTSKTQEAIAAELDITHQRVGQVAIAARRVGIPLHPQRRLYKARNSAER